MPGQSCPGRFVRSLSTAAQATARRAATLITTSRSPGTAAPGTGRAGRIRARARPRLRPARPELYDSARLSGWLRADGRLLPAAGNPGEATAGAADLSDGRGGRGGGRCGRDRLCHQQPQHAIVGQRVTSGRVRRSRCLGRRFPRQRDLRYRGGRVNQAGRRHCRSPRAGRYLEQPPLPGQPGRRDRHGHQQRRARADQQPRDHRHHSAVREGAGDRQEVPGEVARLRLGRRRRRDQAGRGAQPADRAARRLLERQSRRPGRRDRQRLRRRPASRDRRRRSPA